MEKARDVEAFRFLEDRLRDPQLTIATPGGLEWWPDQRPPVHDGLELIQDAEGADLAVVPEATQLRFGSDLREAAEPLDGPFCAGLAAAAKDTGVALVAGVFEPAPDGRVYNTAVAYDGAGELVASYRKLHLFDAFGHRESRQVAPGSAPPCRNRASTTSHAYRPLCSIPKSPIRAGWHASTSPPP